MPPEEVIRAWIAEYGNIFIFQHLDQTFFYRRLTRREYKALLTIEEECDRSDEVCETCVLWPENYVVDLDGPAGLSEVLCAQILHDSGCADLKQRLDLYTNSIKEDVEAQMEAVIDYAFSGGGNFARYQDWSHDQLFDAFARAQWAMEKLQGVQVGAAEEQAPPRRGRRSLSDPIPTPEAPVNNPTTDGFDLDLSGIPEDFSLKRMAERPMREAMQKYNNTQRQIEIRKAALQSVKNK